jgi:hypothetical protein
MKQIKNPDYVNPPQDKHCSNCMSCLREKVECWCSDIDTPISAAEFHGSGCRRWKWDVPKFLYEKEVKDEKQKPLCPK